MRILGPFASGRQPGFEGELRKQHHVAIEGGAHQPRIDHARGEHSRHSDVAKA